MKNNWCSAFPDRWNFIITYDISAACMAHDIDYENGENRKEADVAFYRRMVMAYPKYAALWFVVFKAVRSFGWLPWINHRIKAWTGINMGYGWAKVRQHLNGKISSTDVYFIG